MTIDAGVRIFHGAQVPRLRAHLASFVPARLGRKLSAGEGKVMSPERERIEGAVLFTDISGFTKLTERLAQSGTDGAELLTEILNRYLADECHRQRPRRPSHRSPAMISLSRMCGVRDIDCLIAIVSVIRPGAANGAKKSDFARRAQGLEAVTYAHSSLEPAVRSTFGVVAYPAHRRRDAEPHPRRRF